MASAPRTVQNMPDCLSLPTTVLRSLDDTGAHEKSLLTKFRITYPLFVLFEIVGVDLLDLR